MLREIIQIDEEKCNGCGLCAAACHEGAIGMVNGKAKLLRDDYCDGLGDCLPVCPTNAINFVQREAAAYDAEAVNRNMQQKAGSCATGPAQQGGCPGSRARAIPRAAAQVSEASAPGMLGNWPVQIKLAPLTAPYYQDAQLLVAADCTAFAYADFHNRLLAEHVALIGCPKLDGVDYAEKLAEILRQNDIVNVTVARMEVPCCGGLQNAVLQAVEQSGKAMPLRVVTVGIDGSIVNEEMW